MGEERPIEPVSIDMVEVDDLKAWAAGLDRPLAAWERSLMEAVEEGLEDVRIGRTYSSEEVEAHFAERRREFLSRHA